MKGTSDVSVLYVADFETVVEEDVENQTETEVWSAAIAPVDINPKPSQVIVFNNINDFINHLNTLEDDAIVFFHNEKFDGSFLLNALNKIGFKPALHPLCDKMYAPRFLHKKMPYTYTVSVSAMGQWYGIKIRFDDKTIEIRDSFKKLPFDLKTIGKSFKTKYQKLEMEYVNNDEVHHYAGCTITDEEMDYIKNDVLVLSEAMGIIWYKNRMQGVTIGADCLHQYREMMGKNYKLFFPDMLNYKLPNGMNAYEYCLKAYSGGWCWKNPISDKKVYMSDIDYSDELKEKFEKLYKNKNNVERVKNIVVIDVNSLYPSVMSSQSKSYYPIGLPTFHTGEPKRSEERQFAIIRRFKCRFKVKPGYLPFIHIRNCSAYDSNECLTTSDVRGDRYYYDRDKTAHDTLREYTMTQPEWELFKKHYEIMNYEPIDYLTFQKMSGIFDSYIEKYKQMKINASKSGDKAMRQIAKLFLNNLSGKLSTSTNSSYKMIRFEDDVMKFDTITEYAKDPVYIPAGAYVTAWARSFTITAGQQNYFEGEHHGVMYSDTDSLHIVDMNPDELKGVQFDATDFCKWACEESSCAAATYAKQKTYTSTSSEEWLLR